jgi:hypothetical protein
VEETTRQLLQPDIFCPDDALSRGILLFQSSVLVDYRSSLVINFSPLPPAPPDSKLKPGSDLKF